MTTPRQRHNWLARMIIQSGITERHACCFLCMITMTITACLIAILISENIGTSKWIIISGVLLDIARGVIDRIFGRPLASAISNTETWAGNRLFVLRLNFIVYGSIGCWFLFSLSGGLTYGFSIAAGHPVFSQSILIWVNESLTHIPFLREQGGFQVIYTLPGERLTSIGLSHNFGPFILLSMTLFILFGTMFLSRCLSVIACVWARRNGAKNYSDQAALIPLYVLLLFIAVVDCCLYRKSGHLLCSTNLECMKSAQEVFWYSGMIAFLGSIVVVMASTAESGCLEKASVAEIVSLQSKEVI